MVHRLCFLPVFKWFVNKTEMQKTIKKDMDDTCHMKYIDHFYQLLIKSMLTSHVPHGRVRPGAHGEEAERDPGGAEGEQG